MQLPSSTPWASTCISQGSTFAGIRMSLIVPWAYYSLGKVPWGAPDWAALDGGGKPWSAGTGYPCHGAGLVLPESRSFVWTCRKSCPMLSLLFRMHVPWSKRNKTYLQWHSCLMKCQKYFSKPISVPTFGIKLFKGYQKTRHGKKVAWNLSGALPFGKASCMHSSTIT